MLDLFNRFHRLAFRIRFPLVLGLALAATATACTKPDTLLIRDVYLVSAEGNVSKSPVNVLIEDGRISAIGTEEYRATETLRGRRQYLIPGLIDSHVHLDGVPGLMPGEDMDESMYQQALAQIPRSYLYFGFTTLLDLASAQHTIASWNSQLIAPRAYFCSPIMIPGGYPLAMMPDEMKEHANPQLLHDHHSHSHDAQPGKHSPSVLVARARMQNAHCVKVFYETGFGPMRDLPVPSQAIIREIVNTARVHSLPVFLHGNSASAYEFGLATGVDVIAHGLWHAEDLTEQQLDNIAERIAKAGISVQPTIQVISGELELLNPDFFEHPYAQVAIPPELLVWYQTDAGQWMARNISEGVGAPGDAKAAERYQQAKAIYAPFISNTMDFSRQIRAHKGSLVFGSDTPSGPMYTQFPGLNGRLEIERWHELGIAPPEIFRALTIDNARFLGLEEELGSVEVSKVADLLLLAENPVESIEAYDSIQWVILGGKPIQRASLSALHLDP